MFIITALFGPYDVKCLMFVLDVCFPSFKTSTFLYRNKKEPEQEQQHRHCRQHHHLHHYYYNNEIMHNVAPNIYNGSKPKKAKNILTEMEKICNRVVLQWKSICYSYILNVLYYPFSMKLCKWEQWDRKSLIYISTLNYRRYLYPVIN